MTDNMGSGFTFYVLRVNTMDLPVHVATGVFLGNAIFYVDTRFQQQQSPSRRQNVELGIAIFLVGALSHLILDAAPHYDWLFYVKIFSPLPYWWIIPQILATIPVLLITFYVHRDHLMVALVSVMGGVYPDIEKGAYLNFHLPRYLVLFRSHSCSYSPAGWETKHKFFLIIAEVCLFGFLLAGIYWTARHRNQSECSKFQWVVNT